MINTNFKKPLQLGKGSYGSVWSNSKHEAVKITTFDNWDKVQSTIREVHALRQLNYGDENHLFVRLKKLKFSKNEFHLFMERADMNLHDVKTDDLSADTIEKWAIQMFQTVRYMVMHKMFHRDIKPENILVKKGHICFCDFGLSRHLHSDTEYGTGYIITRWYRSPELLKHQKDNKRKANLKFTEKMDVWSVGAILYELIFDKILAPGKSIEDALKFIDRRVPKLQQCAIEQHEKITERMAKCLKGVLQLDEKKRFDATHALYSLGSISAEKYIEHQTKVMEKTQKFSLQYAPLQPEADFYTSEEWTKRQQYVLQAYKKFQNHKKIIAYAIVVLDKMFDMDVKTCFAESMVYASLVLGSYYNDETCRRIIKTYRTVFDEFEEDSYLYERVAEITIQLESLEVSQWETGKCKSFSKFLGEVLNNPLKKRKI